MRVTRCTFVGRPDPYLPGIGRQVGRRDTRRNRPEGLLPERRVGHPPRAGEQTHQALRLQLRTAAGYHVQHHDSTKNAVSHRQPHHSLRRHHIPHRHCLSPPFRQVRAMFSFAFHFRPCIRSRQPAAYLHGSPAGSQLYMIRWHLNLPLTLALTLTLN